MVFSGVIFVFIFLPITLVGNQLMKWSLKAQNIFLLLISIAFYAYGEPRWVILLILVIVISWIAGILIEMAEGRKRNLIAGAGIILVVLFLFLFKYCGWILAGIADMTGMEISYREIHLPVGISFYTFQAISYMADIFSKKTKASKSLLNVGLYIAFFPQLIAGPIVRYVDIEQQLRDRTINMDGFSEGAFRFMQGFAKKVLLADNMAIIADQAFANVSYGSLFCWLGAVAFTFQIYFDFSGYSDMAVGLGRMFGFHIKENFNRPYLAGTVREFWRRWHISLSVWFRDYVYIPLGGNRKGRSRTYLNIAAVWLLTGIWHGADLTFLMWGGIYGVLVMLEKCIHIDCIVHRNKAFSAIYRVIVFVAIVLLWVVFRAESIETAISYLRVMASFGCNDYAMLKMYFLEFKWEILACCVICFGNVPQKVREWEMTQNLIYVLSLFFFFISICYVVKGGFSPFLYFDF